MSTLYIDSSSGVSGDMMLGAFISLGVPEEFLCEELKKLGLNEFELRITKQAYADKSCTNVDVILFNPEDAWIHPYSGDYRNYREIKEIISSCPLSENAKEISRRIFDIKANAEAVAHGVTPDEVRFHEAGAVDSIVDIVGTAVCCDYLDVDYVVSDSVPTGYGTIQCACGTLPVPAPAVRAVLEQTGIPHYRSDIRQELLTPTGASIIAGLVDRFSNDFIKDRDEVQKKQNTVTGCGVGKRDTGLAPLTLMLES